MSEAARLTNADAISQAARAFGFEADYEAEQLASFVGALRGRSRFIDVGANRGLYSFVANATMFGARIALVEANPELGARLSRESKSWPSGNQNTVEVFPVAAGSQSTSLPFFLGKQDTVGTLVQRDSGMSGETVEIRCEPLDKLFEPADGTLVKIDVEGFEYRALLRAEGLLSCDCRVFIELHGWGDAELAKYPFHVLWLMLRRGFAVSRVGSSYTYDFQKASFYRRWASFFRWAPVLGLKYLIRRSGLRPLFYRVFGFLLGKK